MSDLQSIWKNILEIMQKEISAVSYDVWIKTLEPVIIHESKLVLMASSAPAKGVINQNYIKQLSAAVSQVHSSLSGAEVIEPSEKDTFNITITPDESADTAPVIETVQFNPKYTFSNFVVGKSNQFVDAATRAVAANPGTKHNPLFIYGGVGLGKTHIMHAIGNSLKAERPELRLMYVSSENFTNDLIGAIRTGKERGLNREFRERYRSVDVLMIDDVQFIANKPSVQEEIFHTFNDLYQANKQIIISSDRPPKEIQQLEERLRSRFEWGLTADIQPPELLTRIAILQKKAQIENYNVSGEVLEYIAEKVDTNIRVMEGSLARVVFYASLLNKPLSLNIAKEALKDYLIESQEALSADTIIDTVCRYYRAARGDITGKKKNKEIVWPRQVCMYLIADMLSMPLSGIGGLFGGRDHTTVLHAREKVTQLIKNETKTATEITDIINLIKRNKTV